MTPSAIRELEETVCEMADAEAEWRRSEFERVLEDQGGLA